jgi:site-specific DNA-methyltransferase (adenine-specific)
MTRTARKASTPRRRDRCAEGSRRRADVRLIRGDARAVLAGLPTASVDLVVTDPPYHFAARGQTYFRRWFSELPDDAWPGVFAHLYRVLRRDTHAYVFCDARTKPIFDAAAAAAGFRVRWPLVWDKLSAGLGWCWRPQYEFIAWYAKGSRAGNYRDRSNILRAARVRGGYPTEKPVAVLSELIAQASRPGDLVLDPFCGSGNTALAARQLGRRVLAVDVTTDTAAERLQLSPQAWEPR